MTPFVISRLPWESKELSQMKVILNQVRSINQSTELTNDDLGREALNILLRDVSNTVNEITIVCEKELQRLIVRDSDVTKDKVCERCYDNLWICEPCGEKDAELIKEVKFL